MSPVSGVNLLIVRTLEGIKELRKMTRSSIISLQLRLCDVRIAESFWRVSFLAGINRGKGKDFSFVVLINCHGRIAFGWSNSESYD